MTINDPFFKEYLKHVLKWEGTTSSDPDDTASSCAPSPGAVHTNKGVTYCTFKAYAAALGITPVTHARFLKLTENDIAKFVFHFCQKAEASALPTLVAISVTEAAWGSGPQRAVKHLQDALNKFGAGLKVDGDMGAKTLAAAAKVDPAALYKQYWIERRKYIDYLISLPKYKKWKNGWNNRINDFFKRFPVGSIAAAATGVSAGIALILLSVFF